MELLTALGTIAGIAAVQFARDYRDGKSMFKKNEPLDADIKHLRAHYNEETTPILSEIRDELRKLNQKHDNYEIIGIKTRDCAKEL